MKIIPVLLVAAIICGCDEVRNLPPDPPQLTRDGTPVRYVPKFGYSEITGRSRDEKTGKPRVYIVPEWKMGSRSICQLKFPWGGLDEFIDRFSVQIFGEDICQRIYINHENCLRIDKNDLAKWNLDAAEEYVVDIENEEIRYRRPYVVRGPNPHISYVSYTLKATGRPGEMALDWDGGEVPQQFRIRIPNEQDALILVCGEPLKPCEDSELYDEATWKVKPVRHTKYKNAAVYEYGDFGNGGCRVSGLPEGEAAFVESATEFLPGRAEYYRWLMTAKATKGRVLIDMGSSTIREPACNRFEAVNGLDYSLYNGIHFPKPATRNELRNPSFEQGFYHWTSGWGTSSDDAAPEIVNGGVHGGKALLLRAGGKDERSAAHMREPYLFSMPQHLLNGEKYTVSFYAKIAPGAKPTHPGMKIKAICAVGSNSKNSNVPGNPHFGDMTKPESTFVVGDEWQRFERTFISGPGGFKLFLSALNGDVLFDAVQLERGEKATEFVTDPVEPLLVSSNPRNDLKPGDKKNLAVRFTGQPGEKFECKVTISNFYRENLHEETLRGEIATNGTVTLPLSPATENLPLGIFPIRFDIAPSASRLPPSTFYQRFSIMEPLANESRPAKTLIGTNINPFNYVQPSLVAQKLREWGVGSVSWGRPDYVDAPNPCCQLLAKEGIRNMHSVIGEVLMQSTNNYDVSKFEDRREICEKIPRFQASLREFCMKPITDEQREELTRMQCEALKLMTDDSAYAVSWWNEEEGGPGLVQDQMFEEYFQFQRSTLDAVRRSGRKFKTTMSSGVSNIMDYKVYGVIEKWLAVAAKYGYKYDVLTCHAYGHIDGGRLGKFDLDAQVTKILELAKKYGYDDSTEIMITEMGNEMQLRIPEWYSLNGDTYQYGMPEYSYGHYEALNAASCARTWLTALKFWPRMIHTDVWNSRMFMDAGYRPLFWCKAANTIARMFPDQRFIGDVRPAANTRGYAFRKPDGTGIAALWQTDPDTDESYYPNPKITVRFTQPVKVFDLMENERQLDLNGQGETTFALTMAPLIFTAPDAGKLRDELIAGKVVFPPHKTVKAEKVKAGHSLAGGEQEVINQEKVK